VFLMIPKIAKISNQHKLDEISCTKVQYLYELIVICVFYFIKLQLMRILYFLIISFGLLISCDDPKPNDLLPDRTVNVTVDMGLPMYQNLLVPSGYAVTPTSPEYGFKGILIINRNGSGYVAYDRACPHYGVNDCSAMTYDGLYLKCPCDNSRFNPLNGGVSITEGIDYQAREYHVEMLSATVLRISNY